MDLPLRQRPIGVFDSGFGGLSVLREIHRLLPNEQLIYVGDAGHAPYGDKTREAISARSFAVSEFLVSQQAKAIVVACNTATSAAATALRQHFRTLPIIAMEPAIKPAATQSRAGVVGVLATRSTTTGDNFRQLVERFSSAATILVQPCPGLVELVEKGELNSPQTRELLDRYVQPLLAQGADTLVMGCTHYPFLMPLLAELCGSDIQLIDPAPAVARELQRRLAEAHLLRPDSDRGELSFWSSGSLSHVQSILPGLWPDPLPAAHLHYWPG
ncbi:glutamate racemase [Pokkaliibacter sp. CJK22405]|uniref:glutamate racemase n=1 Tax=Pokkaliibacter sp. CJK22405 TaxID=3384615 RepID=UPI0039847018